MNAVRITGYGGREMLRYERVPTPEPKASEVLVRVGAVGVNRLDVLLREGSVFRVPLPHIPGTDIAGTIVQTGQAVTDRQAGERVLIAPILSCGRCAWCLAGEDNRCESFGTVGSNIPGGYAEYVCVPARNATPFPDPMPDSHAAALPLTYATASGMFRRANLRSGETVVVPGANSGLGIAGMQLAKAAGATVIGVVRSRAYESAVREAGADFVLTDTSFSEGVHEITGGRGADVAFEHIGGATFAESLNALGMDGRMVLAGVTAGTQSGIDLKAVFQKRLSIVGCRGSGRRDFLNVLELLKANKIRPIVEHVLPLNEAAEAQRLLESSPRFGRIVLLPGG